MHIAGNFETRQVTVDGKVLSPARSQRVWNHSPDGFNWGYAGSGPAQLALALLLEAGLDNESASRLHQHFKFDMVQYLPQQDFSLEYNVKAWIAARLQREGKAGRV